MDDKQELLEGGLNDGLLNDREATELAEHDVAEILETLAYRRSVQAAEGGTPPPMTFAALHDAVDRVVIYNPIGPDDLARIAEAVGMLAGHGVSADAMISALWDHWPEGYGDATETR